MYNNLKEFIEAYDNGEQLKSVEMGGISVGYEIAIQDLAIETMRKLQMITIPEDDKDFSDVVTLMTDNTAKELSFHGFSGAQVGAAKNIVAVLWRQTPKKGIEMMESKDPSRIIIIQKIEDKLTLIKHSINT